MKYQELHESFIKMLLNLEIEDLVLYDIHHKKRK